MDIHYSQVRGLHYQAAQARINAFFQNGAIKENEGYTNQSTFLWIS